MPNDIPPSYVPSDEPIPSYKPSLQYFGLVLMKTEFLTPYHYNKGKRLWKPVLLELNSTQLNIYSLGIDGKLEDLIVALYHELNSLHELVRSTNNDEKSRQQKVSESLDLIAGDAYVDISWKDNLKLSASDKIKHQWQKSKFKNSLNKTLTNYYELLKHNKLLFEPTTSIEEFNNLKLKGALLNSYTLLNLIVGQAPSLSQLTSVYEEDSFTDQQSISTLVKYKNVLRVRIELKQILFQFWSFYGMVHWFRMLNIGKDLSLPLDSRHVTKLKSIPSRSNIRNNALLNATAAAAYVNTATNYDDDLFRENEICFNDPFNSSKSSKTSHNNLCDCSANNITSASINESIFSDNEARRASVDSNNTSILSAQSNTKTCKFMIPINNFKLTSYDKYYTTLEKQYISNCIPDLNSFDKWQGKNVTVSNYIEYLDSLRIKELEECHKSNILINYSNLNNLVHQFDKKFQSGKKFHHLDNCCRTFLIHQNGLVSVSHH